MTFFQFPDLKQTLNNNYSPKYYSSQRNGSSRDPSPLDINLSKTINMTEDFILSKKLKPKLPFKSNSQNASPSSSSRKLGTTGNNLRRTKQKDSFNYGDFGLKYFKPIRSNFAILTPEKPENSNNQRGLDSDEKITEGDTKKRNKAKRVTHQLLLSSLVKSEVSSNLNKKQKSPPDLFKDFSEKYRLYFYFAL